MQARRTYGATAKIRLVFRTGDHWMGERVDADTMPEFEYKVEGENRAALDRIEVIRNGEAKKTIGNPGGGSRMAGRFKGPGELEPGVWIYIHAVQKDGEQAWSSPIWLE